MITKIIACGDIHVPSLKGIDQLRSVLEKFIEKCKKIVDEEGKDNVRIVVLGDVFDQKIAITNESILCADWFFTELDKSLLMPLPNNFPEPIAITEFSCWN